MKYLNLFFKKRKKTYFYDILKNLNIKNKKNYKNILINDIQNLDQAGKNDITFFHSSKYKDLLKVTKSNIIISTSQLSYLLPKSKLKLIVDNVLISVAKITEYFYPNSLNDQFENKYINIPIANGYGNYYIDNFKYNNLVKNDQILMKYIYYNNGSIDNIGGISNKEKTVFGMMPHPERMYNDDFFYEIVESIVNKERYKLREDINMIMSSEHVS
ncbi:uncharacterized protein METZ01_LOCUS174931, partial [marine metagenome]